MTTRTQATAAPTTVTIGGKEWRLTPLTDEDVAILDEWVRARHVKMARGTLEADAAPEQRELTERVALAQASTMSFMSGTGAQLAGTVEGWSQIMWCSARRFHADAEPNDFAKMLNDPASLEDLRVAFDDLNNQGGNGKKKAASKKKKKRTRKTAQASKRKNR